MSEKWKILCVSDCLTRDKEVPDRHLKGQSINSISSILIQDIEYNMLIPVLSFCQI